VFRQTARLRSVKFSDPRSVTAVHDRADRIKIICFKNILFGRNDRYPSLSVRGVVCVCVCLCVLGGDIYWLLEGNQTIIPNPMLAFAATRPSYFVDTHLC